MPGNSYYDEGGDGGQKSEMSEGGGGGETALLPKSFFSGTDLKPGTKCDVEIVAVHEDEVSVKPCEGHDEDKGEEMAETPEPASAPSAMSSMME